MKRVALIGNMNNNFFAIDIYIRDLGFEAHVFYKPAAEHFVPKADTFKLDYSNFCHEISWLDRNIEWVKPEEIRKQLESFDVFIGQGYEAAALALAGIKLDIYFPYGSDVYKFAQLNEHFDFQQQLYL